MSQATPPNFQPSAPPPSRIPAPVVALASWLIPGAGYVLMGQFARGVTVGLTVILLFAGGLLVGGIRVVEAPANYITKPLNAIMHRPWFVGQFLTGPMALVTARVVANHPEWKPSHSRVNEIGTLYTAVAGMLNLLGIIDAAHRAAFGNPGEEEQSS